MKYLIQMKNYIPIKAESVSQDLIKREGNELVEEIDNIKNFLENYKE